MNKNKNFIFNRAFIHIIFEHENNDDNDSSWCTNKIVFTTFTISLESLTFFVNPLIEIPTIHDQDNGKDTPKIHQDTPKVH